MPSQIGALLVIIEASMLRRFAGQKDACTIANLNRNTLPGTTPLPHAPPNKSKLAFKRRHKLQLQLVCKVTPYVSSHTLHKNRYLLLRCFGMDLGLIVGEN
jgi:hypothetical protein